MSYSKISQKLGIPKSTLHYWFRNLRWSLRIKKELARKMLFIAKRRLQLLNKAREEKWIKWHERCRKTAMKEFPHIKKNPLFLAGLMLYWGEGDSKIENSNVRLSNTNPEMIKIFSRFLRRICHIPRKKIKIHLFLYPDLKERVSKQFWSKISGIPKNQFVKTQFIRGKHPTRRLANGICTLQVGSRELKEKIFTWIKLYQRELLRV